MANAFDLAKVAGVLIAALGIFFAMHQLARNVAWNQMNAAMQYFDAARLAHLEVEATEALRRLGIEYELGSEPLTIEQADSILADRDIYTKVKYLLNMLECNAAAIMAGAIHDEFAYHQMNYYYQRNRTFFAALIARARLLKGHPLCWEETQRLCVRWEERAQNEPRHQLRRVIR